MTKIDFLPYGKTPRLFRDIVITEKLDGTNAGIIIVPGEPSDSQDDWLAGVTSGDQFYRVGAQSRNRIIKPGKTTDNYGFAQWVRDNAEALVRALGEGVHFGEWYGHGIQHGYGLPQGDRRFALFAVDRYEPTALLAGPNNLDTVPVLYRGEFNTSTVRMALMMLETGGSVAVPGWDQPEGVIVYHSASRQVFKALIESDHLAKSQVGV